MALIYNNIFYFNNLNKLGGTEQFLYEIAKKYKDKDITIIYDDADATQLQRIRKYVRCIKRDYKEKYKCEKAFYNYNVSLIDQVEAKEHIFVCHAIYQELGYKPPIDNPKLTGFIGVSKYACRKLEEYAKSIGMNIKCKLCYNPLTLEPKEKVLHLLSASRLDDKVKGGDRIITFIQALDRYCSKTNRHYIYTIYTNDYKAEVNSPNVTLKEPRLDVRSFIQDSDYVIQLSNDMETYCYTLNEAWKYGIKTISTPLTVLEELKPGNRNLVVEYDMSNVDDIVKEMFESNVDVNEYELPKDTWNEILAEGKSTYENDKKKKYYVEALVKYYDIETEEWKNPGDKWCVSYERYLWLKGDNTNKITFVKEIV